MEKLPLLVLILYSVPESIILITLSSFLYGYKIKENFRRIVLLSCLLALTTYLVRALPIKFGQNALIEIPIFISLTSYLLKVSLKKSFFYILTGFIFIAISENIVNFIVTDMTGYNLDNIYPNPLYRVLYGWCILSLLLIPMVMIIRKNITFTSTLKFFATTKLDTKISVFTMFVLIQAFLAGVLQLIYIYSNKSVWPSVLDSTTLMKVIGFALVTIPMISLIFLRRLFNLSQQEAIIATQDAFIDNVNNLFASIRAQRHDFLNHVQVLYSMMKSGRLEESYTYIDNLIGEIQKVNEIIKIKNPTLSALINTKLTTAQSRGITLTADVETSIDVINVKSLDLVKVLGNLIDNAMEAVMNEPPKWRVINISIKKYSNLNVFNVSNLRPVIPEDQLEKIFDTGYSTKAKSGHSGLGLSIVKEIVAKYKGDFGVESSPAKGTVFTIVIPD